MLASILVAHVLVCSPTTSAIYSSQKRIFVLQAVSYVKKRWPAGADLFLNPDGTSKNTEIYTSGVLDEAYLPVGLNIYKSFLTEMNQLKSDGTIADFSAVPYDWRLSLGDI